MNVSPNSSPTFDRKQLTTERFADERAQKQADKITESSADSLKGSTEEEKTNSPKIGGSVTFVECSQLSEKALEYIRGSNITEECEFPGEFQNGILHGVVDSNLRVFGVKNLMIADMGVLTPFQGMRTYPDSVNREGNPL